MASIVPGESERPTDEVINMIINDIFGENNQYVGPDDPAYQELTSHNLIFFGMNYIDAMKNEWEKWLLYENLRKDKKPLPSDKTLDYLIPLDMSLSIHAVQNL